MSAGDRECGCGSRWWGRAWRASPRRGSWSAAGHEVVVFEKSRGLGGRLAARRAEGGRARPRQPGRRGAARVSALRAADRRRFRPTTGSDLADGVAFASGATRLPKLMAEGLDVRLGVRLAALRARGRRPRARRRAGQHPRRGRRRRGHRPRAPGGRPARAQPRGAASGSRRCGPLAYEPAVMVLLGSAAWATPTAWPRPAPGVRTGPIGGGAPRGGEGTAAASRAWSRSSCASRGPVSARAARRLRRGRARARAPRAGRRARAVGGRRPAWAQVKRWRFAVPRGRLDAGAVNPPGARIVVAGDTLTGAGFGRSGPPPRGFDSGVEPPAASPG